MFVVGVLATAAALYLTFVPLDGPNQCLQQVGPGGFMGPPCPPKDPHRYDLLNIVVAALLYGGPTLVIASVIGWAARLVRRRSSTP